VIPALAVAPASTTAAAIPIIFFIVVPFVDETLLFSYFLELIA
jgi:hypothetical protein